MENLSGQTRVWLKILQDTMAYILIAGGSGFVGGFLSEALKKAGHEVAHLSRKIRPHAQYPTYEWDVSAGIIDQAAVKQADYVINLAGASIVGPRWTTKRKQLIIESRTKSAQLLARTFQEIDHAPKAYLAASAIGFYGNRGDELLDEESEVGSGFLSESCQAWEAATQEIAQLGVPTFIQRIGIVFHPAGGALEKMLLPLHARVSNYFGDGQQWYSWIHVQDIVGIFLHAIEHQLVGIFNGVAPKPARNKTIAKELPKAKGITALVIPAPALVLKAAMGEMSHTILDSTRVSSKKIEQSGYQFKFPELEPALKNLLA